MRWFVVLALARKETRSGDMLQMGCSALINPCGTGRGVRA